MSLTKYDLTAIKTVVKDVVDEAIEASDLRTANGFAEVHEKIYYLSDQIKKVDEDLSGQIQKLDDKLTVKDNKLENTVQRVDALEKHVGVA